ncbi:hypothetical protein CQA49_08860 [Helicobacter sp. MIT 00-7814]|uniref:hypothetical protein n=1 Tax=unclassified Helicobacter TaxID=2593540 RepID=UPI000E1F33B0|nr:MULTISPECIES: hypothetical protein [unclassified Helicobacter]RDU52011.1 hypothetical protein CQA49_08860 [Helicobacter sp. MIT 00-7814]RDU52027.1 hypothetical protein CQA37_09035 [Helicobacter sp. MIT 99-10781]
MTINLQLENANEDFIKAIKSMAKVAQVKVKINQTQPKHPSKELLKAIDEVRRGEVLECKDIKEFKKAMEQ